MSLKKHLETLLFLIYVTFNSWFHKYDVRGMVGEAFDYKTKQNHPPRTLNRG